MADITFVSVPPKSLQQTIDGNATTFKLTDINDWNGTALSSASFGTYAWAVFRNSTNTRIEFMRIDPASITSATSPITIVKRGLAFDGADTEVAANKLTWTQNDTIVELGTHSPQILNYTVRTEGNQTINGIKTFSSLPETTAGNAVTDNQLVRYAQALALLTGSATVSKTVVAGTAGETIVAGNLVYLKASDGRWWLADADTAVSVENVNMGIAQGAGTAGNTITNGVLTYGLDTNQTGLTANSVYYASNTAGQISLTPGTKEVTVGYALSSTTLLFNYRFNQGLTEDQQDALDNATGGALTGANPVVSNNDTTGTGLLQRASAVVNKVDGVEQFTATENISSGQAVCSRYIQADGGIQIDTTTVKTSASGGTTFSDTTNITVGSNNNRALVVFVSAQRTSGSHTGLTVTINGSVATETILTANTGTNPNSLTIRGYVVFNPPTGVSTVLVEGTSNGNGWGVVTSIYSAYNVDTSGVDASSGQGIWTKISSNSITQVTNGASIFSCNIDSGTLVSFATNAQSNTISQNAVPYPTSGFSGTSPVSGSKAITTSSPVICITNIALKPVTPITYGGVALTTASNPTNAVNLNKYDTFIGFATETKTSGQTINVRTIGNVTGLSGLSAGILYYLSNTAGAIATSAGTNSKKVGFSLSTTELRLNTD
jgi:hypothetical protein